AKPLVERFPRMALAYRTFRDSRRLFEEPKQTPMGFKLIGNPSMEAGTFEATEVNIVDLILNHSEVFLNVGAKMGYYCCVRLRKQKYTVAFEPSGDNLQYLYRNLKANNWQDGIEVFPMALSNRLGLLELFGRGTAASLVKGWAGTPEKDRRLVPVSTLDTIV